MARYVRVSILLLTASVLLCAAGCTDLEAGGGGSVAEPAQAFAVDFLREVVAAFVL